MSETNFRGKQHILIIEDDGYCTFFLTEVLKMQTVRLTAAGRGSDAFEMVHETDFDAIMIDLEARNQKDLAPIRLLNDINDQIPVIVVSDRSDVDFALRVLRAGAFDYLIKPFNNLARVEAAIKNAFFKRESMRETTDLDETALMSYGLMGRSKVFKQLNMIIKQIAPLDVNILITGESGTGKELIAGAVYAQSSRRSGPFVAVNCGALPEGLIESLLFGHEKGAFTGAVASHAGYIEKAHRGILFLDEVGELSPKTQVAFLRFIQDHEFIRVGGTRQITSDARIIASTNVDLEEEVVQKRFRADLYFRLNVVHLKAPPLRERREDILYLADCFAKRFCVRNDLPLRKFSPQAASLLEKYDWPGNVRELENLVEGLMATLPINKNTITAKDILDFSERIQKARGREKQAIAESVVGQTYKDAMAGFERSYIKALLERHQGNVAKAARDANLHPVTLHRKVRKLELRKT